MNYQENSIAERIDKDNGKVETIRQLAKRHMMNQFHTTTDEELKNAVVELDNDPFLPFKPASDYRSSNQ